MQCIWIIFFPLSSSPRSSPIQFHVFFFFPRSKETEQNLKIQQPQKKHRSKRQKAPNHNDKKSTTPEHGTYPGVWLIYPVSLCWRKQIFSLPACINWLVSVHDVTVSEFMCAAVLLYLQDCLSHPSCLAFTIACLLFGFDL